MKKLFFALLICLLLVPAAFAGESRIGIISAMDNEVDLLLKAAAIDHVDTIGGIGDDTKVLDVVIGTTLVQHDFGQITGEGFKWFEGYDGDEGFHHCDRRLVEAAHDAAVDVLGEDHVFQGVIATGYQFVASVNYAERLQNDFNAIACEMEGASIALVCE